MENSLRQVTWSIILPGLSDRTDGRGDLLCCPVWALRYYQLLTAEVGVDGRFLFFAPSYAARRASKLGLTHLIRRVIRESRLASTLPGDRVLAVVASSRARDIRAVSASLRFLSSTSWGDLEVASLWRSTSGFLPRLPSGRCRFPSARMARGICAPRLRPWWPPRRSFSLLVLPSLRGRSPLLVPLPPQGLGIRRTQGLWWSLPGGSLLSPRSLFALCPGWGDGMSNDA